MSKKLIFFLLIALLASISLTFFFYIKGSKNDDKVVDISAVNRQNLERSLSLMKKWLLNHSHEDGRIEYKYWPSKDEHSDSNNMIRQFMTSQALGELYNYNQDERILKLWQQNSIYNFGKFYLEDGENGYIIHNQKAKLGAVAVAAMSLISVDNYDLSDSYKIAYGKLINTINSAIQLDFSFKTFLGPTDRNDNQAFYPGEALTALSYAVEKGIMVLDYNDIRKIKEYYMKWWLDNDKELAFIPWHTQAYYRFYKQTKEEHYADAVFEMNDFLISCQTKSENSEGNPKVVGRYYKKGCTQYGPPHSSSTAVYTEGLAYAYALAEEKGDEERVQKYKEAITLGLRSVLQMQISESEAGSYPNPEKALGGVREKITDDEIRVDNVQHAIMAILAVFKFGVLD